MFCMYCAFYDELYLHSLIPSVTQHLLFLNFPILLFPLSTLISPIFSKIPSIMTFLYINHHSFLVSWFLQWLPIKCIYIGTQKMLIINSKMWQISESQLSHSVYFSTFNFLSAHFAISFFRIIIPFSITITSIIVKQQLNDRNYFPVIHLKED